MKHQEEMFELDEIVTSQDSGKDAYTKKIVAPIYEPSERPPDLFALVDKMKGAKLVAEIDAAEDVPDDIKAFLRLAANRHHRFDYAKIADYYASADAPTQRLFERSALVIVDFESAISGGFVRLSEELEAVYSSENHEGGA